LGVKEHGEEPMRKRFEESAVRLLKNIFRVGLFENPYLDIEKTKNTVGNAEFMKDGYNAQLHSVIMLKNSSNSLPLKKQLKVYIQNVLHRLAVTGLAGKHLKAGQIL